ncbi:MAG: hypothetical protein IBJ00_02050 [Alphaproteobacteria bacterium]|nr:hypothetical protein [Alphaproteobacteria bacterium]
MRLRYRRGLKMRLRYVAIIIGVTTFACFTLPAFTTGTSPSDREIEQLRKTLATEQAKTQEITEEVAKKKEAQQLAQKIMEERQKQQRAASQAPQLEEFKK